MSAKNTLRGKGLLPSNYNIASAGAIYWPVKRVNTDLVYDIHSSTDYEFFAFSWLQAHITFSKPTFIKPVRIRIKNTFHRTRHMTFEARGDTDLLKLGYEPGLGGKNSMGFGMVRVDRRSE